MVNRELVEKEARYLFINGWVPLSKSAKSEQNKYTSY
jgi:hypothetical protein